MNAEEILVRAKEGTEPPNGWVVLPLLVDKLLWSMVGWVLGIIIGLGLFAAILPVVVPYNFIRGLGPALITTVLLAVLLFIGLGSVWSLVSDMQRFRRRSEYLIVLTREDIVIQQGKRIVQVPLLYVRHVTARGTPPPDRTVPHESSIRQIQGVGSSMTSFFLGRGFTEGVPGGTRRTRRTPTTLAFVDGRTDDEIMVASDGAYGDPFMIAATLKQYAESARSMVR